MIDPRPSWIAQVRAGGLRLSLAGAPAAGSIRYHERRSPLARLDVVLASLPVSADYRALERSAAESIVTVEGEHAVLVVEQGVAGGVPVERAFGVVFGDDFYSVIAGWAAATSAARVRDEVRWLTVHDRYQLGHRRRRFRHRVPDGWHGFESGWLESTWAPIDYPRAPARLTVHPAIPVEAGAADAAQAFVDGLAERWPHLGEVCAEGLVSSASGLSGGAWTLIEAQGAARRDVVVLEDRRYLYPVVLDRTGPAARATAALHALVRSIEPVPQPSAAVATHTAALMAHWAT